MRTAFSEGSAPAWDTRRSPAHLSETRELLVRAGHAENGANLLVMKMVGIKELLKDGVMNVSYATRASFCFGVDSCRDCFVVRLREIATGWKAVTGTHLVGRRSTSALAHQLTGKDFG